MTETINYEVSYFSLEVSELKGFFCDLILKIFKNS